ncbi:hypothetical protein VM98_23275 [Streptomyces rubellomurinus subsp. indigoferus]|nr:hypothetical protein VM98_23275 [Streptomyces rubellomurinus subsp. indigoferus]
MSETTVTVESATTEGSSCCGSCGTGTAAAPAERAAFQVKGMTCGHCVTAVTAELKKIEGVTEVAVDLATGTVTVDSAASLSDAEVGEAIDEAGYELVGRLAG